MAVAAVVDTDERPPRGAGNGGSPRGGKHRGRCTVAASASGGGRRSPASSPTPGLRFCEVIAESLGGGGRLPQLCPEGWRSYGSAAWRWSRTGCGSPSAARSRSTPQRVAHLAACAEALDAPLVSEHVAFVRAGGREAGHLLPVPRSRTRWTSLTATSRASQAELDVPLALEPIAALFDWPDDEYTEGEFLTALLERTGALLLLDVANVYANARQPRHRPRGAARRDPAGAGGVRARRRAVPSTRDPGVYHDTHTDPVPAARAHLLERAVRTARAPPAVMLERDGRYPPAAPLHAELDAIASAAALPRATAT